MFSFLELEKTKSKKEYYSSLRIFRGVKGIILKSKGR
jgi:hypothetical protein